MRKIRGVVLLFCTLVVVTAHAEEGRIPIFEPVVLDGATSDIQGNYVLTRNIVLDAAATTPVITITGTGVVNEAIGESVYIDLNGFTLTNSSGSGAVIEATGLLKLVVRNGALLVAGGDGIKTDDVWDVAAEDLIISGIDTSPIPPIPPIPANIPGHGIFVENASVFAIRRNVVTYAEQSPILLANPPSTGTIESNRLWGSVGTNVPGIEVAASSQAVVIRDNFVFSSSGAGLKVSGSGVIISNNSIHGATHGIHSDGLFGSEIRGNHVIGGGLDLGAIHLSEAGRNRITDNVINGTQGPCLVLEGTSKHNSIIGNIISAINDTSNPGPGIIFGASTGANVYGGNTLLDHVGSCPNPTTPAACPEPQVCDESGKAVSFGDNIAGTTTGTAGPC